MVIFDAAERGTPKSVWNADARIHSLPPLSLDGVRHLVVLAAHPDDETLGAGGLIQAAAASGIDTDVVVVTDGRASHPRSKTHTADHLAEIRATEVVAAVRHLSPDAQVVFFDVPDGEVRQYRAGIEVLLDGLIGSGESTLVVAPWRGDGHRDHRELGEAAATVASAAGARFAEYAIWLWHWGVPDDPSTPWHDMKMVPLSADQTDAKRRAIAEHRSQVDGLSDAAGDEPMLQGEFLEHFGGDTEIFFEAAPPPSSEYFEELYARRPDPWSFQTRWYEKRKRAITMASIPDERYATALEIGCSIGLLTQALAVLCDRLLAIDISTTAVAAARKRLAGRDGVSIERADASTDFPAGSFDLVVLSEVGYYFDHAGLEGLLDNIEGALGETGTLVACHWRHPVSDYPLSGDEVHAALHARTGLTVLASHVEADFVLEVLSRDDRSVAARTGLV